MREPGGGLDYPSLSSDDAADIGLRYESVPWEDLEAYDQDMFDSLIKVSRNSQRESVIESIHKAALAKRERDAAAELRDATTERVFRDLGETQINMLAASGRPFRLRRYQPWMREEVNKRVAEQAPNLPIDR